MEIRTSGRPRGSAPGGVSVPPDKGAYLRRKSSHRLRKKRFAGRTLMAAVGVGMRVAAAAAAVVFLILAFRFVMTSAHFDLRTVRCEGCNHMEPTRLEEVIRKEFPQNVLQIDLNRLKRRLEREKWIRKVQIRRVLPSELIIYIDERAPSVIAELNGKLILTDAEGVLLDLYTSEYKKLDMPVFSGMAGESIADYGRHQAENSDRISLGLQVLRELDAGSSDYTRRISELDLSDAANVRVLLVDDTTEVHLGDRDFRKRFGLFMANLPQYRELEAEYSDISSVDLRYEGKIIYRPRNLAEASMEATGAIRP